MNREHRGQSSGPGPFAPDDAPRLEPPSAHHAYGLPGPLLGPGGAPEASGNLFSGMYDSGPKDADGGSAWRGPPWLTPEQLSDRPNLLPHASMVQPAYPQYLERPPEPGSSPDARETVLDTNKYTRGVKRALTHDFGVPDYLSMTPREGLIGLGKGASVGVLEPNGIPGPGSPLSQPKLTEGETAAAVAQRDAEYQSRQELKAHAAREKERKKKPQP